MEDCLLWEGHHTRAGEECGEEGAAETCDELIVIPFPVPLHCWGERRREIRSEVKPGRKEGVGEVL